MAELYNCAITNNQVCSSVVTYMEERFLPDAQYQLLNEELKKYFNEYKVAPQYGLIEQRLSCSRSASELLDEIRNTAVSKDTDSIRDQFEEYLKIVQFKKMLKDAQKKYDDGERMRALAECVRTAMEINKFTLKPEEFVDIADTAIDRLRDNKLAYENPKSTPVNSFYIDGLDVMNKGAELRTQLTVFMAMSGVGKTHIARYIGFNCAYMSGHNVLHFQLEGSEKEATDAYSAMLFQESAYNYSKGFVAQHAIDTFEKKLQESSGTLKVRAYPKFGKEISTIDLRNEVEKYKEKFGKYPDVIIIDSLDLLTDASCKNWDAKNLRHKRIAVAQDLKDLAGEVNAWVVATYQATIENPDWVNDEKNVLTAYNTSECKGLQRPCTHLITLNQSRVEYREETMRIYADKFRFSKKSEPFKICTNYEHELFYDRERTLNLPQ